MTSATPTLSAVTKVDANTTLALSYTGRFAAFSASGALVADDKNGVADIYVKDFDTGSLVRVSVGASGAEANGVSSQPSISADGRFVVFTSTASNLVADDVNGVSDVFVKDMQTGAIQMVSTTGPGAPGNGASRNADISADGHYVTFISSATNLSNIPSVGPQVFRKSLEFGVVSLVSSTANGTGANNLSQSPDISADGRYIVFSSFATNLAPGGSPMGVPNPYIKDMQTGELYDGWAISPRAPVLLPIQAPMMSANALQVTVTLSGTVYFLDFATKGASNVSNGLHGEYVGYAVNRAIDADGGRLLFAAGGDDMLGADDNPYIQMYVRDTHTGTLVRLTNGADGFAANANTGNAAMSGDGNVAVFVSSATNLGGSAPGEAQLFRSVMPTLATSDANKYLTDLDAGVSSLAAGAGNDTYIVSKSGTVVVETGTGGHDRVVSNIDGYTLPANVENLILGTALTGSGNELANQIRGNSGNNTLFGGAGNDWITGLEGSDKIDGGSGLDTAVYAEFGADVTVKKIAGGFNVSAKASAADVDVLTNVERIKLNDVMIGLDVDGVGGKAYRVYKAAFDRTPDLGGLGFWIGAMDKGTSLQSVAAGFVQSPEFIKLYGASPDNLSLVTRMYGNVLDRAPDKPGLDFWVDLLDRHVITVSEALAGFSESNENYAAVIGQIENGFYFSAQG